MGVESESICKYLVRIRSLEDGEPANSTEEEEEPDSSSGDAVAARNGLW